MAQTPKAVWQNEEALLDYIFSNGLEGVPTLPDIASPEQLGRPTISFSQEQLQELKALELRAVKAAEAKQYEEAVRLLSEAIEKCPEYMSAYNNRAQVYQLWGKPDKAREDLDKAISLPVSDTNALKNAYTQRGILRKVAGDLEGARADFGLAGKLGSLFARREAAKLNPYAALCNQFLAQAMAPYLNKAKEANGSSDCASTAEACPAAAASSDAGAAASN